MSPGTESDVSTDVLEGEIEPPDVVDGELDATDFWDGEIEREIGHDEYDPVGTVSLIAVYVLIIGSLWVFMYFVEFLGRGPTVV